MVPQDCVFFNDSLRENIRYGRPSATDEAPSAGRHVLLCSGLRVGDDAASSALNLELMCDYVTGNLGGANEQGVAASIARVVICGGALPEVVGNGGLLVDPTSVEDIATAIRRVCGEPALHAALAEGARQRAREFSWDRAAEATLELLESVHNSHRPQLALVDD